MCSLCILANVHLDNNSFEHRYESRDGIKLEVWSALAQDKLYLMHISIHGLIRAREPEIGCDVDTGGQVRYVLDLLNALAPDDRIERVELLTRKIVDSRVSPDYAEDVEVISDKSSIRRISCGPRRYIRKELLWPYLTELIDGALSMIRAQGKLPDVLHAHYADAGFVAARLSKVLGIPVVFTGHSLGRFKLKNLLARGRKSSRLYDTYSFAERFEAEEETIENASLLIASSHNEVEEQYRLYDHYDPRRIMVNPPGCDLARFGARPTPEAAETLEQTLSRFLRDLSKPALIMLARPDPQKNIHRAIEAFAQPALRDVANLVLFLGQRDDLTKMEPAQRALLEEVLRLVDRYDLYGRIAYPKSNPPDMAAALFHYAHDCGGVLLAPSRHENFGLTLVEAAAAGLPVASSGAGGMADILDICRHGITINPDDPETTAADVQALIEDRKRWTQLSENGRVASQENLTWASHIERYIPAVRQIIGRSTSPSVVRTRPKLLGAARHLLVCDIDDTLTGEREAIRRLNEFLKARGDVVFGVATGRRVAGALATLEKWSIAEPQFLISAVGTAIHSNFGELRESEAWKRQIQFRWKPHRIRALLETMVELRPQEPEAQTEFKISYYCENAGSHTVANIKSLLRRNLLQARVVVSRNYCVDVLPVRASKGHALRFLATSWRFDLNRVYAAGDSGNDLDMLRGMVRGIVVANHSDELESLREEENTYFSPWPSAAGVLDGLHHHGLMLDDMAEAIAG
jgi:sucrose-phosphate synthase